MSKIWVVKYKKYGSYNSRVFHSESGFDKFVRNRQIHNKVNNATVEIYELSEEHKLSDMIEDSESEFKKQYRESRLSRLLGDGGDDDMEIIYKINKMITEYLDSKKEDYTDIPIREIYSIYDIDLMKKFIVSKKKKILGDVCSSINDYINILRVHNFRSLPDKVWVKNRYLNFSEVYPHKVELFKEAKLKVKNIKS